MKKNFRSVLAALSFLPLAIFSEDLRAEEITEPLSKTRAIAGLQFGGHVGGTADVLTSLFADNTRMFYGNIQAYKYGPTYQTTGLGAGYRQIHNDAIYGAYGFFDRQVSANKIYYNRSTVGFERLGEALDLRTNFVTPQVGSPSLRAVPREAIQSFTVLLKLQ